MQTNKAYTGPMRFAHRGLVQAAPENTIGAFRAAIDYGCEGIELDIRLSADGEIFIVHDKDLARITDGKITKKICELTSDELRKAELPYATHLLPHDPPVPYSETLGSIAHYSEEEKKKQRAEDKRIAHLMSFSEFDKWFESVEQNTVIEIEFCDPGSMPRMYEILSKSKNCARYILFSGDQAINEEILSVIRQNGKPDGLRLGANISRINAETMDFINRADLFEVGLNDRQFSQKDVDTLLAKGIRVFSNLGDYPEWWQAICDFAPMGFKTNYAEAFTEWWYRRNQ